jgi:hypothetical protein
MNHTFDELTKNLARSVTRRGALKKFTVGVAGIALAALGLESTAHAVSPGKFRCHCGSVNYGCDPNSASFVACVSWCGGSTDRHACGGGGA